MTLSDPEASRRKHRTMLMGRLDIAEAFLEIYRGRMPHHGLALWLSEDQDGKVETMVLGDWPAIPNVRIAVRGWVLGSTVPDDLEDADLISREAFDERFGGSPTPPGDSYAFRPISEFLTDRITDLKAELALLDLPTKQ